MEGSLYQKHPTSLTPLEAEIGLQHRHVKERRQLTLFQRSEETKTLFGTEGHVERNLEAGHVGLHRVSAFRLETEDRAHLRRGRVKGRLEGGSNGEQEEMLVVEEVEVGEAREASRQVFMQPEGASLVDFEKTEG